MLNPSKTQLAKQNLVCVGVCVCDFRAPAALLTVVQAGRPPADPEPFENMIVILARIWPGCLLPL